MTKPTKTKTDLLAVSKMTSNNSEMRCSEYYVQSPTDHTGDQTGA